MTFSRTHRLWLGAGIVLISTGIFAEEPAAVEVPTPAAEASATPAAEPKANANEDAAAAPAKPQSVAPAEEIPEAVPVEEGEEPRPVAVTQETNNAAGETADQPTEENATDENATDGDEAPQGPTFRDLLPLISWTFPQWGDLLWEAWSQGPLVTDLAPGEMLADADAPEQVAQAPTQEPTSTPQDEPKPAEPKPAEPKPAEPMPDEPKPAEPKPAEPKPAEPMPGEPTPADPAEPMPKEGEPMPAEVAERTPAPAEELPVAEPTVDAKELLRRAYEASKTAKTADALTEVINDCLAALAQSPEKRWSDYASVVLGWAYNARGELIVNTEPQQAASDFTASIEHQPTAHQAFYNRGISLAQAGQFAEAERDLTRSLELNPQNAKALFNRGELYFFQGKFDLAVKDYDATIARDNRHAAAYNARGFVRYLQGNHAVALRDFNFALSIDPKLASAYVNRGDLHAAHGDYPLAIADFRQATQLDERSSRAWLSWGWLLATCPMDSVRNSKLAVDYAQAALELEGDGDYRYWEVLAAAQANAEAFDQADASQARAIELAPENQKPRMEQRLEQYRNKQPHREMVRMAGAGINR